MNEWKLPDSQSPEAEINLSEKHESKPKIPHLSNLVRQIIGDNNHPLEEQQLRWVKYFCIHALSFTELYGVDR